MTKSYNFILPEVRQDFPALNQAGQQLNYLDSAASTLAVLPAIRAVQEYDTEYPANIHRGLYPMAERATTSYERARRTIADFIGAEPDEIIFTKNATEGINLVAEQFVRPRLQPGSQILISGAEHHANYLPWWRLAKECQAELVIIPLLEDGRIDVEAGLALINPKTVFLALTLVSNVTGAMTLVSELIRAAKAAGAGTLLDASQAAAHMPLGLAELPVDFVVMTGHKLYGPTGVGVLFGRRALLEEMAPWQLGGDMVVTVRDGQPVWNEVPAKFEAGTPPIGQVIGLGAAVGWLAELGWPAISSHDAELTERGVELFRDLPGFQLLGPAEPLDRLPIFTLVHEHVHSHDLAGLLAERGIAVRAGQHCAAPLLEELGVMHAVRLSAGIYTPTSELEQAAQALTEVAAKL